jgi:fibronectin type 3 domain-containing protein
MAFSTFRKMEASMKPDASSLALILGRDMMRRSRFVIASLIIVATAWFPSATRAQTCAVNIPHVTGEWVTLPYQMPINPISATLLHTGQVLIVAGSENDASNNSKGSESYRAAIWDPANATQSSITVQELTYDVFCSGTAALPDGRTLIVGGTSDYSFTGENRASIFEPNPTKSQFVQSESMANGRWYATATALGDGRIMTFSGLNLSGGTNNTVEIFDLRNAGTGWTSPTTAPFSPPLYPRMALLPGGKVFYTGHGSGTSTSNGWIFNPSTAQWTISAATTQDRTYGSTVILPLLPPNYTPRVMSLGGGSPATSSTEIIDLSASSPSWTPGPNMSTGRIQMNALLLPNGTVLALDGSVNNEAPDTPGKMAELYDPVANTFTSAGTAAYARLYHSTALLLPDATVMSMGSNPGSRGRYEPAIEIYRPAYLFDANNQLITTNRPSIGAINPSSGVIGYNTSFSVSYTSTSPISSAVLVRPGSVTHAFDMEQRLIGLCGPAPQPPCSGTSTLTLTTPPDGTIAPPGYYMLFLIDSAGVPSTAQFIKLSSYAAAPPIGAIASPASDVTIPAGGSVFFGTSNTAVRYSWVFPGGSPATSVAQNPGPVTFNAPGTFVASLTLIDSSGNSDPSPPTRTITVTPSTADFAIAVGPPAQAVIPGQSTSFTVTVTSVTGFTGMVSLSVGSESGFPSGITSGGFSPVSIAGSGSSTLTINTTTSAVPYALSLTITGTSGSLTHTASTTLLVTLAPPGSLTATAGGGQVLLSWPASVGASNYNVKRATVSGGPYVTVGCSTTTSYTDGGLQAGTTYYYVVSAQYTGGPDAGGASANSSEANATPQLVVPLPPSGVKATPGNTQVALSWNASSGATRYTVKRATVSGGAYTVIASQTSTNYTDTGLTNGTTYYYVVTASNSAGESGNSSEVSATPQATSTAAPTNLTANATKPGSINLRWNQSTTLGVTQNRIYRRTSSGTYPSTPTATSSATTSYVDRGLSSRTTYCYIVTAVSSNGESARSNEACTTAK